MKELQRYPESWHDQLRNFWDERKRAVISDEFHEEVSKVLTANSVLIVNSDHRAKSNSSVWLKIARRADEYRDNPIPDLYGVRVVVSDYCNVLEARNAIINHFDPPIEYPWGINYIYDHSNPNFRSEYSHPDYRAIHLYVPFGRERMFHIGEVQLFTPPWYQLAQETREYYEIMQGRK